MPDEDDKKTAKPAEAAGKAPEGPEGEVSAAQEGGDADQDAMMAEWEAMAAEGEEDAQSAQEGQEAGLAAGTAVKPPRQAPGEAQKSGGRMPAIPEVSLEAGSEERWVGKECVSTGRFRWGPDT